MTKTLVFTIATIALSTTLFSQTGPFAPAAGQTGSTAIYKDSSIFIGWGTELAISQGPMDISNTGLGIASYGTMENGLNAPDDLVVSLGDGGTAIYLFDPPIANGMGYDFAIFENSFDDNFLELGFVEVSSNGIDFFRFESTSLTQDSIQTDGFGATDPTLINNLAGKYRAAYGTPFDLEELIDLEGLNINHISHIKIIDVVGSIDDQYASHDAGGRKVNDPYPTPFESGGFDLDAIGFMHLSTGLGESFQSAIQISPNPATDYFTIEGGSDNIGAIWISDQLGQMVFSREDILLPYTLSTTQWRSGMYYLHVGKLTYKIVKL